MPLYEYECSSCGKQFEEMQSIKDKPLKTCKFCGGSVQRLISRSSFALKGGGWYRDGYSSAPASESGPKKPAPAKEKTPPKESH